MGKQYNTNCNGYSTNKTENTYYMQLAGKNGGNMWEAKITR
jgi:hypothetical protein